MSTCPTDALALAAPGTSACQRYGKAVAAQSVCAYSEQLISTCSQAAECAPSLCVQRCGCRCFHERSVDSKTSGPVQPFKLCCYTAFTLEASQQELGDGHADSCGQSCCPSSDVAVQHCSQVFVEAAQQSAVSQKYSLCSAIATACSTATGGNAQHPQHTPLLQPCHVYTPKLSYKGTMKYSGDANISHKLIDMCLRSNIQRKSHSSWPVVSRALAMMLVLNSCAKLL